jgi:hypothetical protein
VSVASWDDGTPLPDAGFGVEDDDVGATLGVDVESDDVATCLLASRRALRASMRNAIVSRDAANRSMLSL